MTTYELTSDSESIFSGFSNLGKHDIIFTTPEKWDSLSRRWKETNYFADKVALIIIDEVHLLNETRGVALEAILSRMKMLNASRDLNGNSAIRYTA